MGVRIYACTYIRSASVAVLISMAVSVAMRVLRCVAVCCSVLQCLWPIVFHNGNFMCVAVC